MSTKSFTGTKKPNRQPTPEEIAAFEETGRAIAREQRVTAKAERRQHEMAEIRETANTETSGSPDQGTQKGANQPFRKGGSAHFRASVSTEGQIHADTENSISAETETQKSEPTVRLTIDLPESVHTRFKAACAITRRKMVDEVRAFIERRTAELESDFDRQR